MRPPTCETKRLLSPTLSSLGGGEGETPNFHRNDLNMFDNMRPPPQFSFWCRSADMLSALRKGILGRLRLFERGKPTTGRRSRKNENGCFLPQENCLSSPGPLWH
jgi:hypothetical protein